MDSEVKCDAVSGKWKSIVRNGHASSIKIYFGHDMVKKRFL